MEEAKERYRWVIEVMVYLGSVMLGMIMFSIGPMLIILTQELQITFTKAALLSGIIALVLEFLHLYQVLSRGELD